MKHLADPKTNTWYHLDDDFRIWSCGCDDVMGISLCLTLDESLKKEGELRELNRKIAQKRKELGLKPGEAMP